MDRTYPMPRQKSELSVFPTHNLHYFPPGDTKGSRGDRPPRSLTDEPPWVFTSPQEHFVAARPRLPTHVAYFFRRCDPDAPAVDFFVLTLVLTGIVFVAFDFLVTGSPIANIPCVATAFLAAFAFFRSC